MKSRNYNNNRLILVRGPVDADLWNTGCKAGMHLGWYARASCTYNTFTHSFTLRDKLSWPTTYCHVLVGGR